MHLTGCCRVLKMGTCECSESADRQNPVTHYVIVRADLPVGLMAAQIVHAAGESGPTVDGTFAVVLVVPDERGLIGVAARLIRERVAFVPIFEPDEPHN